MDQECEKMLKILRDPEQRGWILMSPSSIGETYALCAFLSEFKHEHKLPITLVIPHGHGVVLEIFNITVKRVVFADVMTMRRLSNYYGIPKGIFLPDMPINAWIGDEGGGGVGDLFKLWISSKGTKGLSLSDCYRFKLRLPWSSTMSVPVVPERLVNRGREIITEWGLDSPISLIHSGNNTNAPIPDSLIEKIYFHIGKQGHRIIVNEGGASFRSRRFDFDFIRYVDLNLEDAISVSLCVDRILGGSNGLMNLLCGIPNAMTMHVFPPRALLDGHNTTTHGLYFRPVVNQLEGSMFLVSREWVSPINQYFEWFIPEGDSSDIEETVAKAIALNHPLVDHCISNHS